MAKAKRKSAPKKSGAGSVSSVLSLAKQAKMVDFKFVDLPGIWQHFSIPASELEADMFTDGLGFDGSSIRGWQGIEESDMLVMPDPSTAVMDRVGAWVESFEGPAALVWARRDPILGRGLRRHSEALPQATVRECDAGHFSQEEVPELWAAAIREVAEALP